MDIEWKTKAFCSAWQSLSMIYEDYARKAGISYNTLYILNAIQQIENCTQKQICEKTLLPENRRVKTIHLTEEGRRYADTLIPHIHRADRLAMEALTEEQQDTLLSLIHLYAAAFRREMLGE